MSKAYGGRRSNKAILLNEQLLLKLNHGDAVMVDKGFLIENECTELGIKLIRPSFFTKKVPVESSRINCNSRNCKGTSTC